VNLEHKTSYLSQYRKELYELRFSPMCKPAAEIASVTKLESHSTRSRVLLMWRIVSGLCEWAPREVELIYQSTLDSISEAFDLFKYPVSELMLAARADVWELGLAPNVVRYAAEKESQLTQPITHPSNQTVVLAGEISQLNDSRQLSSILSALRKHGIDAEPLVVPTGASAYALGARQIASEQAKSVVDALIRGNVKVVVTDGPETAWALRKIYPRLGLSLPETTKVTMLSEVLAAVPVRAETTLGKVFVHDSRAACLVADRMASHLAILPGYRENEAEFGLGEVYEAPRRLIDQLGAERLFTTWTRSLAKSCGSDDGLWLTYPNLAAELAEARLREVDRLGADLLITDSPLAAAFLRQHRGQHRVKTVFLPEILTRNELTKD
jgi:Fe-S oxidoreductase